MPLSARHKPVVVVSILAILWSSSWIAIKIGLEPLPPFLSAGLRFFVAFITILIYALRSGISISGHWKNHIFFLWFSVVNFSAGNALVYWGEQFINSGLTSVLFSVMPFYVAFFSVWMLPEEKINFRKLIGISVGFLGILIIFHDQLQLSHSNAFYGMIAVLISPGFSAIGTIVAKKARLRFHPVTLNALPMLYTSITFFIMYFVTESGRDVLLNAPAVLSILYLGIFSTAVAFLLYFWLLKTTSAVLMSLITFVTPPLALLWGWIILGESITWQLILGLIIIFSGILIVRRS